MNRCLSYLIVAPCLLAVQLLGQSTTKDLSLSGSKFVEVCSTVEKLDRRETLTDKDMSDAAMCSGFMIGLDNGVSLAIEMIKHNNSPLAYLKGSMEDLAVCRPDNVTVGQELLVVLKYIHEHPEQEHLPSAQLVLLGEFQAFPCVVPNAK